MMIYRASLVISLHFLLLLAISASKCNTEPVGSDNIICVVKDSNSPRPISLSAGTYLELIKDSHVFVDKSLLIKDILKDEYADQARFIHRPFGWGKSVNLDMIKRFVQLETNPKSNETVPYTETRSFKLFKKGELALGNGRVCKLQNLPLISKYQDLIEKHLAQHPVIYVSFSGLKPKKYREFLDEVGARFEKALKMYDFQAMIDKIPRTKMFASEELVDMVKLAFHGWHDLSYLCTMLNATYGRKPFIFIDDYDEPLLYVLAATIPKKNSTVERIVKSYVSLLHELGKPEPFYERVVLAGTTQLSSRDFTAENLLPEVDAPYNWFHGFKATEVRELGKHLGVPEELINQAVEYYGYRVAGVDEVICSPSSVAKFLANKKVDVYWINNGVLDAVFDKIMKIADFRYEMTAICVSKESKSDRATVTDYVTDSAFIELSNFLEQPSSPEMLNNLGSVRNVTNDIFRAFGYLSDSYEISNAEVRNVVKKKLFSLYASHLNFVSGNYSKSVLSKVSEKLMHFLGTNDSTSEDLELSFLDFSHQLTNFDFSKAGNMLDLLHFVTLSMNPIKVLDRGGDFQGDKFSFSFIILRLNNQDCIVVMSYGNGSAEKVLNETPDRISYSPSSIDGSNMKLVKRVSIHYMTDRKVRILGRT